MTLSFRKVSFIEGCCPHATPSALKETWAGGMNLQFRTGEGLMELKVLVKKKRENTNYSEVFDKKRPNYSNGQWRLDGWVCG